MTPRGEQGSVRPELLDLKNNGVEEGILVSVNQTRKV